MNIFFLFLEYCSAAYHISHMGLLFHTYQIFRENSGTPDGKELNQPQLNKYIVFNAFHEINQLILIKVLLQLNHNNLWTHKIQLEATHTSNMDLRTDNTAR